jgi:antitoxin HicB
MIAYKVKLEPDDNDTLLVTSPDLPGLVTYGEDRAAALAHARDAIEELIASEIADGRHVPRPKPVVRLRRDEALVRLRPLIALKVELYWAMRASGINRAELMRRLEWNRESVDRLFRLDHASRLDQIEAAFRALGRRIDLSIENERKRRAVTT